MKREKEKKVKRWKEKKVHDGGLKKMENCEWELCILDEGNLCLYRGKNVTAPKLSH